MRRADLSDPHGPMRGSGTRLLLIVVGCLLIGIAIGRRMCGC